MLSIEGLVEVEAGLLWGIPAVADRSVVAAVKSAAVARFAVVAAVVAVPTKPALVVAAVAYAASARQPCLHLSFSSAPYSLATCPLTFSSYDSSDDVMNGAKRTCVKTICGYAMPIYENF